MQIEFKKNKDLLLYFIKGSKRYFILAIIFTMIASFFDLINPLIVGFTIDHILEYQNTNVSKYLLSFFDALGGITLFKNNLWYISIIIIISALCNVIARFLFRIYNAKGAENLVKRMRDLLFNHILHLPFSWHNENHTGDIMQRCTSDVDQIKIFLSEQLTSLFRVLVLVSLAIFFMFNVHPRLTIVSIFFIPIVISYSFFFHKKIGKSFEKVDEEEARLSAVVQENLTGVRVVRAFGKETYEKDRFKKQNDYYTNLWIKLMQILSVFWSVGDIFSHSQILSILIYGIILCSRNELSPGSFVSFIYYNGLLTWPVRMLGRTIANLSKANISLERLKYIMNSKIEIDKEDALCPNIYEDIEFKNVSFSYDNNIEILNNINLLIPKGSTLGILGSTGSGKSTLMYLLNKIYDLPLDNGEITIGNIDIRNIKTSYLRNNIGMVLQEAHLFSRSIEDNIRIANEDVSFNEIEKVSKIAYLEETISKFKDGYKTFVGEKGVTLSGGQKQRAIIAQMLIRKPPIMIFDDSLSAVDAKTDANIRQALKENIHNVTTIIISHRINTLMNADNIIVLDKGSIIEEGTHEELIKQNGIYKKINDLQLSNIKEDS